VFNLNMDFKISL